MKTLTLVLAILGSSMFSFCAAKDNLDIENELKKVVKFEQNQLQIKQNKTAFVRVSFKFNKAGKIEIININYSDENVKSQLINKLSEIKI